MYLGGGKHQTAYWVTPARWAAEQGMGGGGTSRWLSQAAVAVRDTRQADGGVACPGREGFLQRCDTRWFRACRRGPRQLRAILSWFLRWFRACRMCCFSSSFLFWLVFFVLPLLVRCASIPV